METQITPRGLSRIQAAAYIGVGVTFFDELVREQKMPRPLKLRRRMLWDRIQIDAAFDALWDECPATGYDRPSRV